MSKYFIPNQKVIILSLLTILQFSVLLPFSFGQNKPKKGSFQRTVISRSELQKLDVPKDSLSPQSPPTKTSTRADNLGDFNSVYSANAIKQNANNRISGRFTTIDTLYIENKNLTIQIVQQGKFQGVIGEAGKILVPITYDQIEFYNQKDSLCPRWEGVLRVKKGGLCALAHYDGSPITALSFEEIPYLSETCEGSQQVFKVKQGGKYGLLDKQGGILIRPVYDDVFLLKNEKGKQTIPAVACVRKQGKYGFLELVEKQILPTNYDKIAFLQQLEIQEKDKITTHLLVKIQQNGKWGVMNLTDKEEIPIEFEEIYPFQYGFALVKKAGKYGFIDLKGKEKIAPKYDYAQSFQYGIALAKKGEYFGAVGENKKEAIPFEYQSLEYLIEKFKKGNDAHEFFVQLLKAKKGDKYGIINQQGKVIIPFEYESISLDIKGFGFRAKKDKDSPEEFLAPPAANSKKEK
ncbi:WG repeat-containing protein [Thermoflexibacter ruber]|uniref:WG containing repeat-containing protein n=1 Tax=Thermoflexibacter ruber TaxID=1003 RepID=A0A1I2JKR5_9BACT|nr:WG repeat-containing protein [Thermoflexibacter ruber]SFF54560.1 WG containing repeat-containing protein [Thermoflexibacter ruber]